MFWILLGTSAVTAFLGLPLNRNDQFFSVLEELLRFQKGFDRKAVEVSLRETATAEKKIPLSSVVAALDSNLAPKVEVNSSQPLITPLAKIDLETLSAVNAFSSDKATVDILVPKIEQLAASIWWRIARRKDREKFELLDVTLKRGAVSESDVELEQKVVSAQSEKRKAQIAWEKASGLYDRLSKLHEMRLKWKAPWKVILKTREKMNEAKTEMDDKKARLDKAISAYELLAKKAEVFRYQTDTKQTDTTSAIAIAIATLRALPESDRFRIEFPVSGDSVAVPVARLTGCEFSTTKAAGLWESVKKKTPRGAIALVESRFSWHYQHIKISGVKIGGMTLLQWGPIVLVVMLLVLKRRIGKAQDSYNPYGAGGDWVLPIVGFHFTSLNFFAIAVLPATACILCVWSLLRISENILLPVLCTMLTLGLGIFCHVRMDSLRNLRNDVTRSHSIPPSGPSR
jgi:hypothetical protein